MSERTSEMSSSAVAEQRLVRKPFIGAALAGADGGVQRSRSATSPRVIKPTIG